MAYRNNKEIPKKVCISIYMKREKEMLYITHIADGLEEFSSEIFEGFLLVLRHGRDNGVEVVAQILGPETEVVLYIRPSLLVYQILHTNDLFSRLLCPLCCLGWSQRLQEEPVFEWQV